MVVIYIGGKEHKTGNRKSDGKPYDLVIIHCLAAKKNVYGRAAEQKIIDQSIIAYDDILVNQEYEVDTDFDGNIIGLTPCRSK